jgi:hypothetical protein
MKESLLLANDEWEMKSTALARILKSSIAVPDEFVAFCLRVLSVSSNDALQKSAFICILEYKNKKPLADGFSDRESNILKNITQGGEKDKAAAVSEVENLLRLSG